MDRAGVSGDASVTGLSGVRIQSDAAPHPEIEPDSWRDVTKFVDRFCDVAVYGVLADPDDSPKGIWIVADIEKVRPAAVPIDQGPTFDLSVLGPEGKVADQMRLTIEEIEHVRAAEPSINLHEGGDEVWERR